MIRLTLALATCLLGLTPVLQAQEPYPFDRVFTTPEERRLLDAQRRGEVLDMPTDRAVEVAPETDKVRFSGYVLRSDGSQNVWIDGKSNISEESVSAAGAEHGRVRPGEGSMEFRARENSRRLKPGQVWLLNRNEVVEGYEAPADLDLPSAFED
ncbi:MAG: hypothetical protein AAGI24_02655 [Pseudomonadota bacterium]